MVFAATAGLWFAEAPHRRVPRLKVSGGTTVYVLGDSISAGIGMEHRCWPTVLHDLTKLQVINLAQPGATVESAVAQAGGIKEFGSLVILEIGGNDLLRGTDPHTFRKQLESLVSRLRSDQHQVLLVELPLFPFQNAFGVVQRNTVSSHGAAMLPKRCFAKVLGMRGGTVDGLHLSQEGHNAMAEIMAEVLQGE
jgi:acyl-CoA thioesterase-1